MHGVTGNERLLSVLCADVALGEGLSRYLDGQEAHYALGRCANRIQRAVESNGGRLVRRNGSRLIAFFGNNVAALQSAIEMQHRVSELPSAAGLPLGIRVGLCTGHLSREARYFPSEGENPAVSLSTASAPGHILLSIPKRVKISPWLPLVAASVPDLALNCGHRELGVFQVAWQKRTPVALKIALSQLQKGVDQLSLRYKGLDAVIDSQQPVSRIGRHPDCEFVLKDWRTSRVHGTIERRGERFAFVDRSTNGTFVTFAGEREFHVHAQELLLSGRGQLSLGAPSSAAGAELVHFETSRSQ